MFAVPVYPVDEFLCATGARCRACHWWDAGKGCRLAVALALASGGTEPASPVLPRLEAAFA